MAQISKKIQIAETALPLFLNDGFKATSIDKVVKASKVSKPTIYNHFPDKEALLYFALQHWLEQQETPLIQATGELDLQHQISQHWLTQEAILFYGLFLGEGHNAHEAKTLFLTQFDEPWRHALRTWSISHKKDPEQWQHYISHKIVASRFYTAME
ncbi:TetR/AcrR family transcriptional regulator [Reinekea thalattae]|uniref:TetR/AcrR family transcriptional regulator n=1 Tax=Reinekea thalattae TaxID=2593301 RepID=A0A5C8ZCB4_9GAMM|nr:TetR/AcrR family transcriptional regulator [Reinekea thalattae]TXR54556.1 TetR/AcrR family transcriptional regulator [Reinekea thalattae]